MGSAKSSSRAITGLLGFVQEDNGGLSATRLAFLLWVIGVLVAWSVVSFKAGQLQALPSDVVTVIGILMTGKVVQKFGEKPADDNQPPVDGAGQT